MLPIEITRKKKFSFKIRVNIGRVNCSNTHLKSNKQSNAPSNLHLLSSIKTFPEIPEYPVRTGQYGQVATCPYRPVPTAPPTPASPNSSPSSSIPHSRSYKTQSLPPLPHPFPHARDDRITLH